MKAFVGFVLTLALIAGGGFAAWNFYLDPSLCNGSPLFDRHGFPSNIPLPSHCHFVSASPLTFGGQHKGDSWIWTFESPNDPSTVATFYSQNLPRNGWTQKYADTSGPGGESHLVYCQEGQVMDVNSYLTLKAEGRQITSPGGSVLLIDVYADP